jgi:hypothetical protein
MPELLESLKQHYKVIGVIAVSAMTNVVEPFKRFRFPKKLIVRDEQTSLTGKTRNAAQSKKICDVGLCALYFFLKNRFTTLAFKKRNALKSPKPKPVCPHPATHAGGAGRNEMAARQLLSSAK